jgi:nucleoside-diphosphate-sugar epimerase
MIIETDTNNILQVVNLEKLKNKSILITGSSGLLGIYIVNCLKQVQQEYNIDVYLWMKNTIDPYLQQFFDFKCNIIKHDITELEQFSKLPMFDFIIHASGYGQTDKILENQIKTIQISTSATINLFERLKKTGTFLFLSSAQVYNGADKPFVTENEIGISNTDHPRACYVESKRCGEAICQIYKQMGIDVKIIRLGLAYGPGTKMNDTRVVNSLIMKAISNNAIELKDNGSAIRTYCYVSDVVEMMWNIMLHGKSTTYNVGGKEYATIYELAQMISKKTNKPVILPEKENTLVGSPNVINISIDKYVTEFNKTDFVLLDKGLSNTISWQQYIYAQQ